MKVYNTKSGILVEHESKFHLLDQENWDKLINDDDVIANTQIKLNESNRIKDVNSILESELKPPMQKFMRLIAQNYFSKLRHTVRWGIEELFG